MNLREFQEWAIKQKSVGNPTSVVANQFMRTMCKLNTAIHQ